MKLKLTPPKKNTFWIAFILGVLGIVGYLVKIPVVSPYSFWILSAGFVLLVISLLVKGL